MPTPSRFPSALQRHHGSDGPVRAKRVGPTAAEVAMMTAEQYKAYAQRRGEWQGADREAIEHMQNPENRDRGRN
jgi:hypothetical protein